MVCHRRQPAARRGAGCAWPAPRARHEGASDLRAPARTPGAAAGGLPLPSERVPATCGERARRSGVAGVHRVGAARVCHRTHRAGGVPLLKAPLGLLHVAHPCRRPHAVHRRPGTRLGNGRLGGQRRVQVGVARNLHPSAGDGPQGGKTAFSADVLFLHFSHFSRKVEVKVSTCPLQVTERRRLSNGTHHKVGARQTWNSLELPGPRATCIDPAPPALLTAQRDRRRARTLVQIPLRTWSRRARRGYLAAAAAPTAERSRHCGPLAWLGLGSG